MKWFCRHWYEVGLFPAGIALIFLLVKWDDMMAVQRISLINFIGIMLHQFEEYGFPGGAPTFGNKYIRGGTDRYPLNQVSAMLVNVVIAYISYLLPVFFPSVIWLGLAPILFGCVFQVMLHLVVFLVKFHHFYNSGLAGTLEGISARAERVCLVYPVIDFLNYAHEPSFQAISGGSEELRDKLSIQKHVPKEFPPTYAWACRNDELVPYENCELIARALEEAGVPCKSHIYPQGCHGCGLAKGTSAEGWMDEMLEFYRGSLSCE